MRTSAILLGLLLGAFSLAGACAPSTSARKADPTPTAPPADAGPGECQQDAECQLTGFPLGRYAPDGARYCPVCPRRATAPVQEPKPEDAAVLEGCPKAHCEPTSARCVDRRCVVTPARPPFDPPTAESFALPAVPPVPRPFPALEQPATKWTQCQRDDQCTLGLPPSCECRCNPEQVVNTNTARLWAKEQAKRSCSTAIAGPCQPCVKEPLPTPLCFRGRCADARVKAAWEQYQQAVADHPRKVEDVERKRSEILKQREEGLADH